MSEILRIWGREILDSRGLPTVEVEITTKKGSTGRAGVPSGASTGAYEAHELRDGDSKRFGGKGVLTAVKNINDILAPRLMGQDAGDQKTIDRLLCEIDGTDSKSKIGANAILGVSLASLKAAAQDMNMPLFKYLARDDSKSFTFRLPVPLMNVLNGGAHANNGLDVQEFMIVPNIERSFRQSLRAGSEIFHSLKKILNKKGFLTAVGDEGGFAPKLENNRQALELLVEAVESAGYSLGKDVFFALDVAATELYRDGTYRWEGGQLTGPELSNVYSKWLSEYPIFSIEDGFAEDDWSHWSAFTKQFGSRLQIVGDDLFVTNPKRIKMGIDQKAANCVLIKVNQIGTVSEAIESVRLAQLHNYRTVMSHRSGETEDAVIADLAVGLGCQQIKTGGLCRGERIAKYNQLLRIEELLAGEAMESPTYWGAFNIL